MYSTFHILHLLSLFILVGVTFAAFAAPEPDNRKRFLMYSGIASLVVLITGFGLLGVLKIGFPIWIIAKLICWLILSGLAGVAFRKRDNMSVFVATAIIVVAVAVTMVSMKPF